MPTLYKLDKVPTARMLLAAFRAFENELAQILSTKGFSDITAGNFNVIRHLNPEGMRLTELAKDAEISKQAIGKLINELQNKGYVEILPDKLDGRAKFVQFSAKGRKMINAAVSVIHKMENHYEKMLGKQNYTRLRESVNAIYQWHLKRGHG